MCVPWRFGKWISDSLTEYDDGRRRSFCHRPTHDTRRRDAAGLPTTHAQKRRNYLCRHPTQLSDRKSFRSTPVTKLSAWIFNFSELKRKIIILLKNKTERAESKLLKIGKFVSTSCLHTLASFVPILMTYILTMFAETLQRKRKLTNTNAQRNSTNKGQRAVHFIWSFRERHLYCVEPERWKADSLKSTRPDKQSGLLALNSNLLIISGSRFQLSRNAACFSSTEKETSILFPKLFLLSPLQHRSYTEENWANEKSVSFFACVSSRSRFFETQCSSLILCKTENPRR